MILDLDSRRVVGWAVSNRMKRDLAIRALKMCGNRPRDASITRFEEASIVLTTTRGPRVSMALRFR